MCSITGNIRFGRTARHRACRRSLRGRNRTGEWTCRRNPRIRNRTGEWACRRSPRIRNCTGEWACSRVPGWGGAAIFCSPRRRDCRKHRRYCGRTSLKPGKNLGAAAWKWRRLWLHPLHDNQQPGYFLYLYYWKYEQRLRNPPGLWNQQKSLFYRCGQSGRRHLCAGGWKQLHPKSRKAWAKPHLLYPHQRYFCQYWKRNPL